MNPTYRYHIDLILKEWRSLKENVDRNGEPIKFSQEGLTLNYEPMSRKEALRLIETGEYVNLPEDRKHIVLAKLRDAFDRAEQYWDSSSAYC